MTLRNNPENPYSGLAYKVVGCDYCKVLAGELCVVRWSKRHTQGLEDHEARAIAKVAAYDAWEKGWKQGRSDVRDRLTAALLDVGIVVTSEHLYTGLLERVESLKAENDALKAPDTEVG